MAANYINDQWVQEDSLGLGRGGDAVAKMSLEVSPPFTIGVTGKWGCGKTSIMRRAFATLGGQPISQDLQLRENKTDALSDDLHCRIGGRAAELKWADELYDIANQSLCIWYSPWQHQNAANPLIPLLQEIRAQYSVKRKLFEKGKHINRQSGLAALTLLEHAIDAAISFTTGRPVKMAVGASENIRKAWNDNNPENLTKPSDGQRFHLLFEDAVENVLEDLHQSREATDKPVKGKKPSAKLSDQARLIIFIDDLDRCEEKAVVALLEAIKLYLGARRCVFILGVDDVAVGNALKRHWQGRSDDDNREYLEKLFQATISVPQPLPIKLQGLISQQLSSHNFPDQAIATLASDIEALLEPNPRKVKNFLNSLCANWQMLRCDDMDTEANCRRLVMFQYLRTNHLPVWRLLEREPILLQLLQRVLVGNSNEPLKGLPNYLSTDDLRMTEEIFSRSFAHVLKHDNPDDLKLHRRQTLEIAVDKALEKLDRRRSDQYFVNWVNNGGLVAEDNLPRMYLQITSED
ncbi:hypothetical protein JCM14076_28830 [Methylosoma difficile]